MQCTNCAFVSLMHWAWNTCPVASDQAHSILNYRLWLAQRDQGWVQFLNRRVDRCICQSKWNKNIFNEARGYSWTLIFKSIFIFTGILLTFRIFVKTVQGIIGDRKSALPTGKQISGVLNSFPNSSYSSPSNRMPVTHIWLNFSRRLPCRCGWRMTLLHPSLWPRLGPENQRWKNRWLLSLIPTLWIGLLSFIVLLSDSRDLKWQYLTTWEWDSTQPFLRPKVPLVCMEYTNIMMILHINDPQGMNPFHYITFRPKTTTL